MDYPSFISQSQPIDKTRHHIPHWDQGEICVFVTFRLEDSLPADKLAQWDDERLTWLNAHPKPWTEDEATEYGQQFGARLDKWLDAGYGECLLDDEVNREIVWNAILHFDNDRYDVYAFVVMGNHVHVLFAPRKGNDVSDILHSWKSYTAKIINKRMNRTGGVWQLESWDRLVRNERHFRRVARYIVRNPGKSGVPFYVKRGFEEILE